MLYRNIYVKPYDIVMCPLKLELWHSYSCYDGFIIVENFLETISGGITVSPIVSDERSGRRATTFLIIVSKVGKRVPKNNYLPLARCLNLLKGALKWHNTPLNIELSLSKAT